MSGHAIAVGLPNVGFADSDGRHRSAYWYCARAGQGPPSQSRVHRVPQYPRHCYPAATAIKVILDNHSAHISRETKTWLAAQPDGRFAFVFTPKHGSWLNLIEGFFSKAARSVLRHIRVKSTHELKQRIIELINDLNRDPVIHRWRYKIDLPA